MLNYNDLERQKKELLEVKNQVDTSLSRIALIERELKQNDNEIKIIADSIDKSLSGLVLKDKFIKFFKKPYAKIPYGKNKVLIVVPKFIKDFQVGWLFKEVDNFFIYQLDQYSAWLGDVPKELLDEINFKQEFKAEIIDDRVFFDPSSKDIIKKSIGRHLTDFSENQARIIKGHEFEVIADMVECGNLPFKPKPISKSDLRECKSKFNLRNYQKPAYNKFLETGAVGLFHPTGAGKSMVALKVIDSLKGAKIIFVPTKTLVEQWEYYLSTYLPHLKNEVEISTYQGYRNRGNEYVLVVYDECQRLPANTFSRLAVINAKYRLGLSASPHREDKREKYIFALTGFPVGLNWHEYMDTVGKSYHPIYVHVVRGITAKIRKVSNLIDYKKKTLIFCDGLELGRKLSRELGVPFVFGKTDNRLETIESNKVIVCSRVLDLGVSIKDLQRIIEVDFLFGSRQQELQRTGRLMHSELKDTRHDIIFTEKEIQSYGKRLWSLQEKGFTIKVVE